MSGLVALLRRDGAPADPDAVKLMLDAAAYRGPDGMRQWSSGRVALGFAKMAVTVEDEAERQPLVSPRTGCALIADARLGNRAELLASLGRDVGSALGDAEIILWAYEKWGVETPQRLLGDFAFVVWDPRHERLFCARDTGGQRSLYYRIFFFNDTAATEIHQLLQDPSVPVEPNEDMIRESLVPIYALRNEKQMEATFYRGIWSVPAGHAVIVGRDSMRTLQYWQLEPKELRYQRDSEYAEHYKDLLFEVLRSRLRGRRPVGVLLSGGIDSSSIACVTSEISRTDTAIAAPLGFTWVFDKLECDERELVEEIRAKYGIHVRYVPTGTLGGRLDAEPRGFLESPSMGVAGPREAMYSAVAEAGLRSVLTGDVADSCAGGSWLIFDAILRRGGPAAFLRYVRSYRALTEGTEGQESLRRIVALYSLTPLLPLWLQRRVLSAYTRRAWNGMRTALLPFWMPAGLRDELSRLHLSRLLAAEQGRRFPSPAREWEFQLLYPPELAPQPAGWSFEVQRPFADRRLHEFLLAIPPERKIGPLDQGWYAASKRIPREAMRGILPEAIRTRTGRTEFTSAVRTEIEMQWPDYERVFGPHGRPEVAAHGYVDRSAFWARLQEVRAGAPALDLVYIIHLIDLETWLRALRLPRAARVRVAAGPDGQGTASDRGELVASASLKE